MIIRQEALNSLKVGSWVADAEADSLPTYFLKTSAYQSLQNDECDIVYGDMGMGKTALRIMLMSKSESFFDTDTSVLNPHIDAQEPPFNLVFGKPETASELAFKSIWLALMAGQVASVIDLKNVREPALIEFRYILESEGLIPAQGWPLLRWAKSFIRAATAVRLDPERAAYIFDGAQKRPLPLSQMLVELDKCLQAVNQKVVLLFDRLDVPFQSRTQEEFSAIRGLFRAYRQVSEVCKNVKVKIFLRSDIWSLATARERVPEMAQISARAHHLHWSADALFMLVVARLARSSKVLDLAGMSAEELLDMEGRKRFFYAIMPQVVTGRRPTFDWLYEVLQNGQGTVSPRDVVHLVASAIQIMQRSADGSVNDLPGVSLVSPRAFLEALLEVSKDKRTTQLYHLEPRFQSQIEKLAQRGMAVKWSIDELADAWGGDRETETLVAAEELTAAGFFRKVESQSQPYWISEIYKPALGLGQNG